MGGDMGEIISMIIWLGFIVTFYKQYQKLKIANIELNGLREEKSQFESEKSKYIQEMNENMSIFEATSRKKDEELKGREEKFEKKVKEDSETLDKILKELNTREQRLQIAEVKVIQSAKELQAIENNLNEVVDEKYKSVVARKREEVRVLEDEASFLKTEIAELERQKLPLETYKLKVEKDIFNLQKDFAKEMIEHERRLNETQRKTLKAIDSSRGIEIAIERDVKQTKFEEQHLAVSKGLADLERNRVENERVRNEIEKRKIKAEIARQHAETQRLQIVAGAVETVAKIAAQPKTIVHNNQVYHYTDNSVHDSSDRSDKRTLSISNTNNTNLLKSAGARVFGALPSSSMPALGFN